MFGSAKTQAPQSNTTPSTSPAPAANGAGKPNGTTYDLCKVEQQADGTKKFTNLGTVFIRANGTGGVAYVKDDSGQKLELAIFKRRPREVKAA